MYRARVEAVSGTKVLAGGKWLQCIGNKPVRVGEHIWTDGRCVYGNYQESQQPLVITAPDEEPIPIIALISENISPNGFFVQYSWAFYNFERGKLKLIEKIDTDKRDGGMMINDFRRNVFFAEDISAGGSKYKKLLATNITRRGDRYEIISLSGSTDSYYEVQICKNDDVIQTIDIDEFYQDNIVNECLNPPSYPFTLQTTKMLDVHSAFIEDENNWRFFVDGFCHKALSDQYTGPYDGSGSDPEHPSWVGYGDNYSLGKIYQFTKSGEQLLYKRSTAALYGYGSTFPEYLISYTENLEYPELDGAKLILQDGFYCKMRNSGNAVSGAAAIDFYNKSDEFIFSMEALDKYQYLSLHENFYFAVQRVSFGYLLSICGHGLSNALYLIKNGTAEQLLSSHNILNQRLRPMTKYKNWHKRIQELTIK